MCLIALKFNRNDPWVILYQKIAKRTLTRLTLVSDIRVIVAFLFSSTEHKLLLSYCDRHNVQGFFPRNWEEALAFHFWKFKRDFRQNLEKVDI